MSARRLFRHGAERRRFLTHLGFGLLGATALIAIALWELLELSTSRFHRSYLDVDRVGFPLSWSREGLATFATITALSLLVLLAMLWKALFDERRRRCAASLPFRPGESLALALGGPRGTLLVLTPIVAGALLLSREHGSVAQLVVHGVFGIALLPAWFALLLLGLAAARGVVDRLDRAGAFLPVLGALLFFAMGAWRTVPFGTFDVLVMGGLGSWVFRDGPSDWCAPDSPLLRCYAFEASDSLLAPLVPLGAVLVLALVALPWIRARFEAERFLMCPPRVLSAHPDERPTARAEGTPAPLELRRLEPRELSLALHFGVARAERLRRPAITALVVLFGAHLGTLMIAGAPFGPDLQDMLICGYGPLWMLTGYGVMFGQRSRLLDLIRPIDLGAFARRDRWIVLGAGLVLVTLGTLVAATVREEGSAWTASLGIGLAMVALALSLRTMPMALPDSDVRTPVDVSLHFVEAWLRLVVGTIVVGVLGGVIGFVAEPEPLVLFATGTALTVAYALGLGLLEDRRIRLHHYALGSMEGQVVNVELRGQDFAPTLYGRRPMTATGRSAS